MSTITQTSTVTETEESLGGAVSGALRKLPMGFMLFLFGWRTWEWVTMTFTDPEFITGFDWVAFDMVADRFSAGEEIYVPLSEEETLPWLYPPVMVFIFLPLRYLGEIHSWEAIVGVLTVAFLFSCIAISKSFELSPLVALVYGLGMVMPSSSILMGQLTMLTLAVVAVAMHFEKQGRATASGLTLAFLALKPPLLLLAAPVFLLRGTAQRAVGFAVGVSGLIAVHLVLLPTETQSFIDSSRRMAELQREDGALPFEKMANVFGWMIGTVGLHPTDIRVHIAWISVAVISSAVAAWAILSRGRTDWMLAFALGGCLAVMASPRIYWYDAAVLLIPVLLMATRSHKLATGAALLIAVGSLASGFSWGMNLLFVISAGLLMGALISSKSEYGRSGFSSIPQAHSKREHLTPRSHH